MGWSRTWCSNDGKILNTGPKDIAWASKEQIVLTYIGEFATLMALSLLLRGLLHSGAIGKPWYKTSLLPKSTCPG